ncbi:hypothetical protein F441_18167 [Phytophthora nicotianae CJ01A1]|uniref:Reverse transcriptase RNase H-like domain-containing protein n=1 Tax=Phytophthora nicotianae CJ01A1 TaxID=1317063 RepID=W2W3P4_PHYNI|nr:hypothetical protein F441_18167 [Phytophthora nicotianae CJ01A1]
MGASTRSSRSWRNARKCSDSRGQPGKSPRGGRQPQGPIAEDFAVLNDKDKARYEATFENALDTAKVDAYGYPQERGITETFVRYANKTLGRYTSQSVCVLFTNIRSIPISVPLKRSTTAPVLRHFDPDRVPVVVVYASDWAISAALVQEHEYTYMPVTLASRTVKPNELNCNMVEKEILALLRILDVCYSTLVTRPIKVLTRHSTLAWLMQSTGLQGRLGNCAALLSPWTLEFVKCTRGEDEILGTIAASITPRESVDSILSSIAPRKQPRQLIPAVIPTVEQGEELLVVNFDGSARAEQAGGACSDIVWQLLEWIVVAPESK